MYTSHPVSRYSVSASWAGAWGVPSGLPFWTSVGQCALHIPPWAICRSWTMPRRCFWSSIWCTTFGREFGFWCTRMSRGSCRILLLTLLPNMDMTISKSNANQWMLASMWDVQGSTSAIFKLFPSKKSPHTHTHTRGWGPVVRTEIWSLRFRSGSGWDLELAVEVWPCTLRCGARSWGGEE